MKTQDITIDFSDYSAVYTSSIANKIIRALFESMPNKYNHVYASDIDQIIYHLQKTKEQLQSGAIMTSENCVTKGI